MKRPASILVAVVYCACFPTSGFVPAYVDITSIQTSLPNNSGAKNYALNASIYATNDFGSFGTNALTHVFWGAGFRTQVGDHPKIEVLGKVSMLGYAGASLGPYWGQGRLGISTSAWFGLGLIGLELTHYLNKRSTETQASVYLSFGSILFLMSQL